MSVATPRRSHDRRLLDLVAGAYAFEDLDEFRMGILGLLRTAVPHDVTSYNEVDDDPSRTWWYVEPEFDPLLAARFPALVHEHPVITYVRRTRDGRPRRISDFLDEPTWHGLALYRDFFAPAGLESQVSFSLPSRPPIVVGIALSRAEGDFTDAECQLLGAARPHLIQAYRTIELATARAATIAALEAGLDAVANPVLVVDRLGRIEFATDVARQVLQDRLGLDPRLARLPASLVAALDARRDAGAATPAPLLVDALHGDTLTIRVLPSAERGARAGGDVLLLEPGTGGMSVAALEGMGLTRREAEALRWIALGRSGPEAARIMGISPRTVEKHLERVYGKLGVTSGSQASATAWAAVGVRHPDVRGSLPAVD
jgi:DNA-binding CsgD family transcriptional regulator